MLCDLSSLMGVRKIVDSQFIQFLLVRMRMILQAICTSELKPQVSCYVIFIFLSFVHFCWRCRLAHLHFGNVCSLTSEMSKMLSSPSPAGGALALWILSLYQGELGL